MTAGSTPAAAPAIQRAIGLRPSSAAFSAVVRTSAAAPSLMPAAFAAVTVPSGRKAGRSFAMLSGVTPSRGCSSVSKRKVDFFCFTSTGTISSLKTPAFRAASHFCWLAAAKASCSAREMANSFAIFSAVTPIWTS